MNKLLRSELSDSDMNRISIWISVFNKISAYISVCEIVTNEMLSGKEPDFRFYRIEDRNTSYEYRWVIQKGLLEATLAGLLSIFSNNGRGGDVISDNSNKRIKGVRREIMERAAEKCGCMTDDLEEYLKRMEFVRNKTVAHYDGIDGLVEGQDYSDGDPIHVFKMPSAVFSLLEIQQLKKIILALFESLLEFLREEA